MELKLEKIDPKKATELLAKNTHQNRHIKQGHLERLMYDMEHDLWDANNGETLKLNALGELVDGQHRLHAIIQTGKTYHLPVLYGVSADSFYTLDSGSSRTLSDILSTKNIQSPTAVSAAVVTLQQFYMGNFRTKQLSHRVLLNRFEDHRGIVEFVGHYDHLKKCFRPNEAIFLSYCFHMIAPKKGAAFIEALKHGGLDKSSPVHQFREKMIGLRMKRQTGYVHLHKDYVIGSCFKAWNWHCRGRDDEFKMLQLGEDIEYPIGFGKYFTDIEIGGIER